MQKEYRRLCHQLEEIQAKLAALPQGKLICTRNGHHFKWYQTDGHQKTYIPRQEQTLAQQLAFKKYLSLQSQYIAQEKRAIEYYLSHHKDVPSPAEKLLTAPQYKELLDHCFTPISQELSTWAAASYEQNRKYPEQLIYKTGSGNTVRSKSEAMIDMLLHVNSIPFRYECELQLGETTLYPDFTLRHPLTGNYFYWEHFGMMDNPAYCRNVSSKLQLYFSHGIIPSINLITTYETKDDPLDVEIVDGIIQHYFL